MKKLTGVALFALLLAGPVTAQTDSVLGSTSTDRVDLTASIDELVLINQLPTTFDIGTLTPGTAFTSAATDLTFCVYSNTAANTYTIQADGGAQDDGANGTFALLGTVSGEKIEYTIDVDDAGSFVASDEALGNGVAGTVSLIGQGTDPTCAGAVNGSIELGIAVAEINEAAADAYTDTLVLTVSPL